MFIQYNNNNKCLWDMKITPAFCFLHLLWSTNKNSKSLLHLLSCRTGEKDEKAKINDGDDGHIESRLLFQFITY